MAFKSSKNFGTTRTDVVRVVKKDSNFIYVPNKLTKGKEKEESNKTEIRMLPYVDDAGTVYDALHPQGSVSEMADSLGLAFCRAELLQFYKGGLYTLLTSVKDEDKEGNTFNARSPWGYFMNRMHFKVDELTHQVKQGGKVEPGIEHWANLKSDNVFSRPQTLWFIQVLAKKINGESKTKNGKMVPMGPGVFAIPRYIQTKTEFFSHMLSVDDDEAGDVDLSPTTCKLGDFYTPENGRYMRLSRSDIDNNTSYAMELAKQPWPLKVEDLKKMVSPWDDILDIMYVEDAVKEIAKIFEPRMLAYAFRNSVYAPYIQAEGINLDMSRDIIEADVAIVKGERTRTVEEINEHLQQVGSDKAVNTSGKAKQQSNSKPVSEEPDSGINFDPTGEDDENNSRYQEALSEMGELQL